VQHKGRVGTHLYCIRIAAWARPANAGRALVNRAALRLGHPASIPSRNDIWRAPSALRFFVFLRGSAPRAGKGKARHRAPPAGSPRSSASRFALVVQTRSLPRGPFGAGDSPPGRRPSPCYPRSRRRAGVHARTFAQNPASMQNVRAALLLRVRQVPPPPALFARAQRRPSRSACRLNRRKDPRSFRCSPPSCGGGLKP
jgi:hypothetical protein